MNHKRTIIFLLAITFAVIFIAGCTTQQSQPATATPTAITNAPVAQVATSAPTAQPTPECPDAHAKGVWDGAWDTREVGYASNHDIRDVIKDWNGINSPGPMPVTMSQKCWNVTGTFGPCVGALTGTIEGNQLKGSWNTVCPTPADNDHGTFIITMAADNQSWIGYMYSYGGYDASYNFAPNWAGKR